jgi:hypothetical protein
MRGKDEFTIKQVQNHSDLNSFVTFPWKIYNNDCCWVPPIINEFKNFFDRKKNPFLKNAKIQLFIAYHGKEPVGTIGTCINYKHNEIHKDKTGFFGFFESIDDISVSRKLFSVAENWLKENGMNVMRGPMNFSTHDPCGLLIEGFDTLPSIMTTYNPRYYMDLFNDYGFIKSADLYAYKWDIQEPMEQLSKVAQEINTIPNLKKRNIDFSNLAQEAAIIKNIYNSTMSKNWGYLPFTDEEIENSLQRMKSIINPDLAFFVDINGETVGFILSLPDYNIPLKKVNGKLFPIGILRLIYNKRKIDRIRVVAIGVKPNYQDKRLGAVLYHQTMDIIHTKYPHIKYVEASWINEYNIPMNRALKWMGLTIYKTYRIYDYPLHS